MKMLIEAKCKVCETVVEYWAINWIMAREIAEEKGWTLGKRGKLDRCPKHYKTYD